MKIGVKVFFHVSKSKCKDPFQTGQSIGAKVTAGCHGYMQVFVKLQ